MNPVRRLKNTLFPVGIPLAWLQLAAEKKRFAAAVAGITFAVAMMMFQMGLKSALFDQVVAPLLHMRGDVVVVNPNYEYFGVSRGFSETRLFQSKALPEVVDTSSIFLGNLAFKNPVTGRDRDVFIMAYDPATRPFKTPEIVDQQDKIQREGVVLFDARSRAEFGPIEQLIRENGQVYSEISGKRIVVEGIFNMGATFAADGNLIMGKDTLMRAMPGANSRSVSVGLINLRSGADPVEVAQKLREFLPGDVKVMTMAEFVEREKEYWADRTPIGFVISASMAVALVVGAVIVYQILYTDVSDHIEEYATLKSIGFKDSFFVNLVLQESFILSFLGFVPGTLLTAGLYYLTRKLAFMPTYLTWQNVMLVLVLTLVMCASAGALATRKLRQANPAEIF